VRQVTTEKNITCCAWNESFWSNAYGSHKQI